ncbi:MAG TPA: TIGR02281 family clan AA aspartic protease [Xanthobacteraceae bacterium]|nr:TIGR02281 family clan AA aspartic protease [Xanthobacteraceae bacterium]
MRHALLWILLLGLSLAVVVMASGNGQGTIGDLTTGDFASLLVNVAWLVLIGGVLIVLFRDRITKALEAAVLWIVIALLLMLGYTYRFQLHDIADQVMAELIPGRTADSGRTVALARAQSSDFQITTDINGHSIPMILDTGASSVVLTNEAAKAVGLPVEVIKYTVNIATANGHTKAAEVTLDRVAVGSIVERAVPALIAQPGQLKTSLLGMSFLNRLQSWEVRGDKLVLRGYP